MKASLVALMVALGGIGCASHVPVRKPGIVCEQNERFSAIAYGDTVEVAFPDKVVYSVSTDHFDIAFTSMNTCQYFLARNTGFVRQALAYIDDNNDRTISDGEVYDLMLSERQQLGLSSIEDEAEAHYIESSEGRVREAFFEDLRTRKYVTK